MEAYVLVAGEQVKLGARHTCQLTEVVQRALIYVDTTDTLPLSLDVANARLGAVETLGATAKAAAEMEVVQRAFDNHNDLYLWINDD